MIFADAFATYIIAATLATSPVNLEVSMNEYLCMVEAIHFESSGESTEGKEAVANVILNRVKSRRFPNDVCGVVNQRVQFSYRNNGAPTINLENLDDKTSFKESTQIALDAVNGTLADNVAGANHHINPKKVKRLPNWYYAGIVVSVIGNHEFLKL